MLINIDEKRVDRNDKFNHLHLKTNSLKLIKFVKKGKDLLPYILSGIAKNGKEQTKERFAKNL